MRRLPPPLALLLLFAGACDPASDPDSGSPGDSDSPADYAFPEHTTPANDRDFYELALNAMGGAQERVRVIEYLIYDGNLVDEFLDALRETHARGVPVEVLADEEGEDTAGIIELLAAAGIEARLDSPDTTTHNKLVIADDVTLVGSHNWTSSALRYNHEATMLVADAQVTSFYNDYFEALWEDSDADPELQKPPGDIVPIKNREIADYLGQCLDSATERIRLVLYALHYDENYPDSEVADLLETLEGVAARGVSVRVVLDASDWTTSNQINDRATERLLAAGIEVRNTPSDVTTHAKMLLCDETVIVGDANWSYSAFEYYNGTSIQLTDPQVAAAYQEWFDSIWEESSVAGQ